MSIFQLDSAFILEVASISAGLITLHKAAKEPPASLLRVAGYLLMVAGVLTAVCSLYYGVKYSQQGDFDHDAGATAGAMSCPMMKRAGMMDSMKPGGMMMDGMSAPKDDHPVMPISSTGPSADSLPKPADSAPDSAVHQPHHPAGKP